MTFPEQRADPVVLGPLFWGELVERIPVSGAVQERLAASPARLGRLQLGPRQATGGASVAA